MGWNSLHLTEKGKEHPLFKYSKEGDYVYFVHSFYGKDCDESLLATSEYGIPVTASAANENVMGCQFHPEKSGEVGLRILKAFSEI
jgi:glutamine amidotransferase